MEGSQNHRYYIYNIKGSDMGYCLIFNFQTYIPQPTIII